MVDRFHVWVHLFGIPFIYLFTDGLQFFLVKNDSGEKKMFCAWALDDFIMLLLGSAFAVVGWYIAFPYGLEKPSVIAVVRVEDVAAAAILVLWNIAYVHYYPDDASQKIAKTEVDIDGPAEASTQIVQVLESPVQGITENQTTAASIDSTHL